jgi:uncharacterized RDD family membrane protein YckC
MSEDPGGATPLQLSPVPPPSAARPPTQNRGSPYPKAELLPRLLARLFDLMVCGALAALMHRAGAAAGALYLLLADGLFRGQSLGKRMLGIKVVHVPTRLGAGARQSMVRNFPMALVGLLAMGPHDHWRLLAGASVLVLGAEAYRTWTDPLGLRLGDGLASTQVVDGKAVAGMPALAGAGMGGGGQGPRIERLPRRVARSTQKQTSLAVKPKPGRTRPCASRSPTT